MEDIAKIQEKIGESVESILRKYDAEIESMFKQLDKIVNGGSISNDTPQKNKKKAKRLSIIADTESEDSVISEREAPVKQIPADSSKQEAKNTKEIERKTSSRPVRAAKLKVENCLKEKPLNNKLRRPSGSETTLNETNAKIKQERKSDSLESGQQKENVSKQIPEALKRKSSERGCAAKDVEEQSKKVKVDESLVILNNNEPATVELSDDEGEKMPPPVVIPKKRNARRKAGSVEKVTDIAKSNAVKEEKQSLDSRNDRSLEPTIESVTSKSDLSNIKKEKVSDVDKLIRQEAVKVASTKGKKGRKQKHKPIKEEKPDEDNNVRDAKGDPAKASQAEEENTRHSTRKKQASLESVYEDAISVNLNKEKETTSNEAGKTNKVISNTISSALNQEAENNTEKATDATFLSAVDVPYTNPSPKNDTLQCPQSTFVMQKESNTPNNVEGEKKEEEGAGNTPRIDQTFTTNIVQTTFVMNKGDSQTNPQTADSIKVPAVSSACNDATFRVNTSSDQKQEENKKCSDLGNSILTEDDSEEEFVPLPKPTVKAKTKNELFNPFIQSPVKKKVEAFEKHANTVNESPSQQRQTRTKTRAQNIKENKEPQSNANTATKTTTPNLVRNIGRLLTPTQQTVVTSNNNSALKKAPTSASKLVFPKLGTKTSTAGKTASLSRDSSTEDMKRGINKYQVQQLEEKKKKREQKQQMATQTREAKEKERADKLKKAMQEREEKVRRKAMETEQKRQLEEINRNLKLQEEKREAQKRLEKQKQLEMAEVAKREREMLEAMKIKAKEKLLQERKLLELKKMGKKTQNPGYDFHMLNSDDSTDDEGKTSSKRPPPPTWSRPAVRQLIIESQANLPTKIIDSFFSIQPMTPDLRQIFPKIDSRYLKRNSSVFWRTPPRYSQLPKY